jgi:hypothetical protein
MILWVAARTLIAPGEPEAAGLSAEIIGGLSYLAMAMGDPELRNKWFAIPMHQQLSEIVGFNPTEVVAAGEKEGPQLTEEDLGLLRDLAAGSVEVRAGQRTTGSAQVSDLLAKLGVQSENEAIEYAIRAGVTWQ